MKDVTLKESVEITEENEEIKDKVAEGVKSSPEEELPDELLNVAGGRNCESVAFANRGSAYADEGIQSVARGSVLRETGRK